MTIHTIPGKLVVIEGIDGSGKDTQADLLVSQFGYEKTRLPFYDNDSGALLRKYIDSGKIGISEERFQAAMTLNYIEHYDTHIKPLLDMGKNVVMTRYVPSMYAYAKSFDIDWGVLE
jgi:dTMP kinase